MLQAVTYLILLSFGILCIRVYKRPGIAAALVWSMIVLESVVQQGNSFLLQNAKLMNYAVGGIAAAAAVWAILNRRYKQTGIPKQVWLYAGLIGFCVLSVIWSVSPEYTASRRNLALPYIVAFGFLAPMCIFDEKQLAAAIKTTVYFGGLIVIGIVLSETGRRGVALTFEDGRIREANPLAAASYAGYVGLACLFSTWGKKLASFQSILKVGIIFVCLVAMIKSGSRGQLISFSIVSVFWLPIMTKATVKRSVIVAMIAFLAAGLMVIGTVYLVDALGWEGRWNFQQLSDDHRDRLNSAFVVLEKNLEGGPMCWLFGLGTSASFKYLGTYPHNIYLETIAEEGLVGMGLLIAILSMSFYQGFRMMQSDQLGAESRENTAILMAMFSFNLILAAKQGSLLGSSSSVFCLALTIAWMHARVLPQLSKRKSPQYYFSPYPQGEQPPGWNRTGEQPSGF